MEELRIGLCCCISPKRPLISFKPPKRIEVYHLEHEERVKIWNPKVSTNQSQHKFFVDLCKIFGGQAKEG